MTANAARSTADQQSLTRATIRFAGDSGDGIQLTGTQFTQNSALAGHDLATLPDFPAEIRAPAGTLPGVSAFQIQFAAEEIFTPGDTPDVLVAMNAAALKKNIELLKKGGTVLINTNGFEKNDLKKAGYEQSPLEDGSLDRYSVHLIALTDLTIKALEGSPLSSAEKKRSKNFYALGILFWLFDRDPKSTQDWIKGKFGKKPDVCEANLTALKAGQIYGDVSEMFQNQYVLESAKLDAGDYRNITGNNALAIGLVAATHKAEIPLFLGSYPITPASDILHSLSKLRNYNVITFQAEDEIAAVSAAVGASFTGNLGLTTTSGPGLALKGEAVGLAVITELPLVVVNVQRGGPSTGLPTKTEQSDLLQAMYGRNGECPVPIIAPRSPGDAFWAGYEAVRIATKYMIPVLVLSDGYIANGAEPWLLPKMDDLPEVNVTYHTDSENFKPYSRDAKTLARPWAIPGTPNLEHRIGGIEKENLTGNVSYDPDNHDKMCRTRASKVLRIRNEFGPTEVNGADSGDLLLVSWGSTYGSVWEAVRRCQAKGQSVSHLHLRWLNPLPSDLGDILKQYKNVLVPEINLGQLLKILRAEYLVDAIGFNLIRGLPFKASEIEDEIQKYL
jgi:2-oxoglutarate ferredoxin oxidoreductase subunit alpha